MADVANDRIVFHSCHVVNGDDCFVAGGRHKYVCNRGHFFKCVHLVTLHCRLQRIDRVDFGDNHSCALAAEALCTTLANVAVAADHRGFAGKHHVGRTVDCINQRMATTVEIVELGLGDAVVDIDSRKEQLIALGHFVQTLDACGRFFCDALNWFRHLRPLAWIGLQRALQEAEHDCKLWV